MLIYPKNADLEGTSEEGRHLLHSSNPENPGSETELGLVAKSIKIQGKKESQDSWISQNSLQ